MNNYSFLAELLSQPCVSGFEDLCLSAFERQLKGYGDLRKLNSHSVVVTHSGNPDVSILLDAHIDTIGFQVNHISSDGFVSLRPCGGIDSTCFIGHSVTIHGAKDIKAVIGKLPIHMRPTSDLKPDDVLIADTGTPKSVLSEYIMPGDFITIDSNMKSLGENKISCGGMDNKVGLYVITEAFKRLCRDNNPLTIHCLASTEEESGGPGANTAAFELNPTLAIVVDTDIATDYPGCNVEKYGEVSLGKGVILNRNLDSERQLVRNAIGCAQQRNIPHQITAGYRASGGTNACVIRSVRNGIPVLNIGIACRYLHTPVEVCDKRDIDAAIDLICAIVINISA